MRIGISCIKYGSGDHGGVQIFLRSYIEALSRIDKSENEYILIFDKNVNLESMAISNNFKSFVIDIEREINFFFRILKRLFKHTIFYQYLPLYYSEKISKQLSDLNLDVIHFPATTIDIPFELPLNCKKIITFHDLQHEFFPEFFSRDELSFRDNNYKMSLEKADSIIAISDYTSKTIINKYRIPKKKIKIIYEGYSSVYNKDLNESELIRIKNKYDLPRKFIFYPGNPWPHKNHRRLLEALILLYKTKEFNLPLVISGVLKGQNKLINKLTMELEFPLDKIIDLGFIDEEDMPSIYYLAGMLVYPSLFEGFGIPLIEAMKCGCPIVCSKVTSIPEVCQQAAMYIDPDDIESIAKGIYSVHTDQKLRKKLIDSGKIEVRRFEWDNLTSNYIKLYHELIK